MKKTIRDYEYKGKKVLLRCDLNVPINDNYITDDTRIKESLKTINYLVEQDAKVIILSHLGKVKTEEDKEKNTLYPVYLRLKELLDTNIYFSPETRGKTLQEKVKDDALLVDFNSAIISEPQAYFDGNLIECNKGIMAGVPISGFLANLYLEELDRFFYEKGILYARYSDDIIVFGKTKEDVNEYKQM